MASEMEYTGERIVPCKPELKEEYCGHLIAYVFSSKYVKDRLVLDAGCGTGYGAYQLSGTAKGVIGIDVSREAVAYSKNHYTKNNAHFIQMDVTHIGFSDNIFDVICSFQVVEHIEKYEQYLIEMKRILKTDGILVLSTPNKKTFNPYGKPAPFHFKEFYLAELKPLLQEFFKEVVIYGQSKIIKQKRQEIVGMFLRMMRIVADLMPLHLRILVGGKLIHLLDDPARYELDDFAVTDVFIENTSMNIIAVCKKPL